MSQKLSLWWTVVVAVSLVLAVGAAGRASAAGGWGGTSDYNKWNKGDQDRVKQQRIERLQKELAEFSKAIEAIRQQEQKAREASQKAEEKAAADAGDDEVKRKRLIRLVRHKEIAALLKIDAQYMRLFATVTKMQADAALPEESKGTLDILLVQIKTQARANRERIADLYEQVDDKAKALKMLQSVWVSLSEQERGMESALKDRIDSLKKDLGIRTST